MNSINLFVHSRAAALLVLSSTALCTQSIYSQDTSIEPFSRPHKTIPVEHTVTTPWVTELADKIAQHAAQPSNKNPHTWIVTGPYCSGKTEGVVNTLPIELDHRMQTAGLRGVIMRSLPQTHTDDSIKSAYKQAVAQVLNGWMVLLMSDDAGASDTTLLQQLYKHNPHNSRVATIITTSNLYSLPVEIRDRAQEVYIPSRTTETVAAVYYASQAQK
jgi:hypothetical protein